MALLTMNEEALHSSLDDPLTGGGVSPHTEEFAEATENSSSTLVCDTNLVDAVDVSDAKADHSSSFVRDIFAYDVEGKSKNSLHV